MSPTGGSAVEHYSDPQRPSGSIINSHTRTLYPDWPEGSVVKVKGSTSVNTLKFRCRTYDTTTDGATFPKLIDDWATAFLGNGLPDTLVFDTTAFTAGDNKVYSSVTLITNIYRGKYDHDNDPNTADIDYWDIVTTEYIMGSSGEMEFVSSNTQYFAHAPDTTGTQSLLSGNVYLGGIADFTDWTFYATYSGEVDYDEMHTSYPNPEPTDDNYSSGGQVLRSSRAEDQSAHGLSAYIAEDDTRVYAVGTLLKNGLFTYVLNDSDVPLGVTQKTLVKGRWVYTPDSCRTCPYAGKTVTIEAKFKQATVTRSVTPAGQTLSIGTWSDHSTQTFTLTLPDSLTAQELGTDFDFPTSPGKVVALDDLKLVSIS
jgi:hypothetical protein